MSQDALEARYRLLLWAYPRRYRRERGAEMIGTLMDAAAPDQRRPTVREATVLVLRGLQTRAGTHGGAAASRGGHGALRLAVLLLLTYATAGSLAKTGAALPRMIAARAVEHPSVVINPLTTVVAVGAVVGVAAGRYVWGLLATLGALAGSLIAMHLSSVRIEIVGGGRFYPPFESSIDFALGEPAIWPLPLAALLLIALTVRPVPGARRPTAWLLAVPVAVLLLPTDYETTIGVQPWATAIVMAAFLVWVAVDARATIAAGVLLIPLILSLLSLRSMGAWDQAASPVRVWFWSLLVGTGVLLTAGALALRRQART
jgi:hypothetical protein